MSISIDPADKGDRKSLTDEMATAIMSTPLPTSFDGFQGVGEVTQKELQKAGIMMPRESIGVFVNECGSDQGKYIEWLKKKGVAGGPAGCLAFQTNYWCKRFMPYPPA
jgi:hypothetical protein